MQKPYQLEDITVIIPTYNRSEDLAITLKSLLPSAKKLKEIIIVDQSSDEKTKKLIKKLNNKKIKYVYSKIPSISISRNIGIKNLSGNSRIVCFLDDDVNISKLYFDKILEVFNTESGALAVGGYIGCPKMGFFAKLENFLKKIFFIGHYEKNAARIISAYGNSYPSFLNRVITAQWLPGVNMVYKKEVFNEQKFDENLLGYTIAEDIDFGYRLWKKHPESIFITPYAKIIHRASKIERCPTKKMGYINQIDHFYFFLKNMGGSAVYKLKFAWSLLGISLLRTLNMLIKPSKITYLKWKYFFSSLFYCLFNLSKIRKGILRDFQE